GRNERRWVAAIVLVKRVRRGRRDGAQEAVVIGVALARAELLASRQAVALTCPADELRRASHPVGLQAAVNGQRAGAAVIDVFILIDALPARDGRIQRLRAIRASALVAVRAGLTGRDRVVRARDRLGCTAVLPHARVAAIRTDQPCRNSFLVS